MLNMLLSFAQFEREMISERTRDKIAATRRKGKWTGGMPLLGYDVVDTKLVVNEVEAERVRQIFELYLELGSLLPTVQELDRRGWTTKHVRDEEGNPAWRSADHEDPAAPPAHERHLHRQDCLQDRGPRGRARGDRR